MPKLTGRFKCCAAARKIIRYWLATVGSAKQLLLKDWRKKSMMVTCLKFCPKQRSILLIWGLCLLALAIVVILKNGSKLSCKKLPKMIRPSYLLMKFTQLLVQAPQAAARWMPRICSSLPCRKALCAVLVQPRIKSLGVGLKKTVRSAGVSRKSTSTNQVSLIRLRSYLV